MFDDVRLGLYTVDYTLSGLTSEFSCHRLQVQYGLSRKVILNEWWCTPSFSNYTVLRRECAACFKNNGERDQLTAAKWSLELFLQLVFDRTAVCYFTGSSLFLKFLLQFNKDWLECISTVVWYFVNFVQNISHLSCIYYIFYFVWLWLDFLKTATVWFSIYL